MSHPLPFFFICSVFRDVPFGYSGPCPFLSVLWCNSVYMFISLFPRRLSPDMICKTWWCESTTMPQTNRVCLGGGGRESGLWGHKAGGGALGGDNGNNPLQRDRADFSATCALFCEIKSGAVLIWPGTGITADPCVMSSVLSSGQKPLHHLPSNSIWVLKVYPPPAD